MQSPNLVAREILSSEFSEQCNDCPFIDHINAHLQKRLGTSDELDALAIAEATEEAAEIGELTKQHQCSGHEEVRVQLRVPEGNADHVRVVRICAVGRRIIEELGQDYADMTKHRLDYLIPDEFTA